MSDVLIIDHQIRRTESKLEDLRLSFSKTQDDIDITNDQLVKLKNAKDIVGCFPDIFEPILMNGELSIQNGYYRGAIYVNCYQNESVSDSIMLGKYHLSMELSLNSRGTGFREMVILRAAPPDDKFIKGFCWINMYVNRESTGGTSTGTCQKTKKDALEMDHYIDSNTDRSDEAPVLIGTVMVRMQKDWEYLPGDVF